MKTVSISFLLSIIRLSTSSAQWTEISPGIPDVYYNDMYFINNDTGFIVGSNYFQFPLMIKTIDGGATWNTISVSGENPLTGVWFINDTVGFVSTCNVILKSSDQGTTWDTAYVNSAYGFDQLQFVNENVGYAICDTQLCNYGSIKFLKTTDGGNIWSVLSPTFSGSIRDFYFITEDTGIVSGSSGGSFFSRTFTGGNSWSTLIDPYIGPFNKFDAVIAVDGQTFMAANNDTFVISHNGGNSFLDYSLPSSVMGNIRVDMVFTSSDVGWICGGSILRTEDGGITWSISDSTIDNYGSELGIIKFPSAETGYAAALYNGLILKYVESIAISAPSHPVLTQVNIFPNPFTTSATVAFSLNEDGYTEIILSDLSGSKLQTLVSQNFSLGNHEITIDRNQFSGGMYLLTLQSNRQTVMKKVLLQ